MRSLHRHLIILLPIMAALLPIAAPASGQFSAHVAHALVRYVPTGTNWDN